VSYPGFMANIGRKREKENDRETRLEKVYSIMKYTILPIALFEVC
jgi:hypothetical protein